MRGGYTQCSHFLALARTVSSCAVRHFLEPAVKNRLESKFFAKPLAIILLSAIMRGSFIAFLEIREYIVIKHFYGNSK